MDWFGAIASDPAARRVREAATRGTLSHALLITGGGDRSALARYAAAAMECESRESRPCGRCPACSKVLRDIHPDVLTVRDEEHKAISAEVVRSVRQDAWIRPNEGARKVYLFPDCSLLTERDQNILLKVVEEGPPYAAFLFCAGSGGAVLQTLRSRCVELILRPAGEQTVQGPPENGEALCRAALGGSGAAAEAAVRLERARVSREEAEELLHWCRGAFAAALLSCYGREAEAEYRAVAPALSRGLTRRQLASAIDIFGKYAGECALNVGTGHIWGALAAELEGLH